MSLASREVKKKRRSRDQELAAEVLGISKASSQVIDLTEGAKKATLLQAASAGMSGSANTGTFISLIGAENEEVMQNQKKTKFKRPKMRNKQKQTQLGPVSAGIQVAGEKSKGSADLSEPASSASFKTPEAPPKRKDAAATAQSAASSAGMNLIPMRNAEGYWDAAEGEERRRSHLEENSSRWIAVSTPPFEDKVLEWDFRSVLLKKNKKKSSSSRSKKSSSSQSIVRKTVANSVNVEIGKLRDVPLKFRSSQEYTEVFLPLVLEEAIAESKQVIEMNRLGRGKVPWPGKVVREANKGGISKTSNEKAALHTLKMRYVLNKYKCDTNKEMDDAEKAFKSGSRYKAARAAEHEYLRTRNLNEQISFATDLSAGDLVILSRDREFISERGIAKPEMIKSCMLALVTKSNRINFVRMPASGANKTPGYEIECVVEFLVPTPPSQWESHYVGWKTANCVTSWREYDAIFTLAGRYGSSYRLLEVLLACKSAKEPDEEASIPGFQGALKRWLDESFNPSQKKAILKTVSKTKGFTLIQGPPGTGKTHTLLGLLNVLHVSVFHRFYSRQLPSLDVDLDESGPRRLHATGVSYSEDSRMDRLNQMPHILVTAPSNTAVDGMIEKLMKERFRDSSGNLYLPETLRFGRGSKGGGRSIQANDIEIRVDGIIEANRQAIAKGETIELRMQQMEARRDKIHVDLLQFRQRVDSLANNIRQFCAASISFQKMCVEGKFDTRTQEFSYEEQRERLRQGELKAFKQEFHHYASLFHQAREKLEKCQRYLDECAIFAAKPSVLQLRAKLKDLLLERAQIVFVTLSSSALRQIHELRSRFKFEVVVVDEAAQSSEPGVLVPLQHEIDHCVLVGDPRQLPATILSDTAQRHYFQQSLFERLQTAGHPSYLLDTQYRCHPAIARFPSKYFYEKRLKNGENVEKDDYAIKELRPFRVFQPLTFLNLDLSKERRQSRSYFNEEEADLALHLYVTLRRVLANVTSPTGGSIGIGIITPYREQLEMLRRKFRDHLVDPMLALNTVDGYQGREFDLILFSCVRASSHEDFNVSGNRPGIGFLKDARRLNVAITRAKFGLFVIGQESTLRSAPLWAKFIDHIKSHGTFVDVPGSNVDLLLL